MMAHRRFQQNRLLGPQESRGDTSGGWVRRHYRPSPFSHGLLDAAVWAKPLGCTEKILCAARTRSTRLRASGCVAVAAASTSAPMGMSFSASAIPSSAVTCTHLLLLCHKPLARFGADLAVLGILTRGGGLWVSKPAHVTANHASLPMSRRS